MPHLAIVPYHLDARWPGDSATSKSPAPSEDLEFALTQVVEDQLTTGSSRLVAIEEDLGSIPVQPPTCEEDALNGRWGARGKLLLDLRLRHVLRKRLSGGRSVLGQLLPGVRL